MIEKVSSLPLVYQIYSPDLTRGKSPAADFSHPTKYKF
jgi:hypothetical protein